MREGGKFIFFDAEDGGPDFISLSHLVPASNVTTYLLRSLISILPLPLPPLLLLLLLFLVLLFLVLLLLLLLFPSPLNEGSPS